MTFPGSELPPSRCLSPLPCRYHSNLPSLLVLLLASLRFCPLSAPLPSALFSFRVFPSLLSLSVCHAPAYAELPLSSLPPEAPLKSSLIQRLLLISPLHTDRLAHTPDVTEMTRPFQDAANRAWRVINSPPLKAGVGPPRSWDMRYPYG